MNLTDKFILAITVLVILYDLLTVFHLINAPTISDNIYLRCKQYPVFTFLMGVLIAHWLGI